MNRVAAVALSFTLAGCFPNYSDGERVGVITKISRKGIIWKSWEGSLNQGGTKIQTQSNSNGDAHSAVVPNAIDFNVDDAAVLAKVKDAADTGKVVKITYREWLISPPWIDASHVVTSVTEVK
jgi:hypothetical protein